MATFSQGFLQSLMRPSFSQNLFQVGQQIGSAPARQRAAQQQAALDKGLFGLEQMALSGDLTPEMYKEAVGSYTQLMRQNPQASQEIRESLGRVGASVRQQSKQQTQIAAKTQLENLKQAAIAVQMSEGISPQQKQENLARFRVEAQKIIDANPNVDLTAYANFGTDVETSVYQLDKLRTTQATTAAVETFSNQLFQIKDYDTLQTTSDALLKANPEYAEEIKKLVDVQQTSIENREKRERAEIERGYDITGSVEDIRERAANLPTSVQQIINDNLDAAAEIQKENKNSTGWTNTPARDRARELIDRAERVADDYVIRQEANNIIQLRGIDNDLQTLLSKGPDPVKSNEVENLAEEMSLRETGKKLSDISSRERSRYITEARTELLERNQNAHDAAVSMARARRASITGEKPEEPVKAEETPAIRPLKGPEDYDGMVSNALARGNTLQSVRNSLTRIGVPAKKIVALVDKYNLPVDVDFIEQSEEVESKRPSTAVPFVYTQR